MHIIPFFLCVFPLCLIYASKGDFCFFTGSRPPLSNFAPAVEYSSLYFQPKVTNPLSTVIIWPVSDLRELETLNTKIQVMIDFKEPKLSKIETLEVRSENR